MKENTINYHLSGIIDIIINENTTNEFKMDMLTDLKHYTRDISATYYINELNDENNRLYSEVISKIITERPKLKVNNRRVRNLFEGRK